MKRASLIAIMVALGVSLTATAVLAHAEINHRINHQLEATPNKVKNLRSIKKTDTSVTLRWKALSDIDNYQVRVMNKNGKLLSKKLFTTNKASITELTADKVYTFKVRAKSGGTFGKYSKQIQVRTQQAADEQEEPIEEEPDDDVPEEEPEDDPAQTVDISISGSAFSSTSVTVNVGDTIRWTNNDSFSHTASEENGVFNTGTLSAGETVSITMTQAGSFDYFCVFHPGMMGTIIVAE